MQLTMLQLLLAIVCFIAAAIGSSQAAIATLPNDSQEFATSTSDSALLNVDSLLAFPKPADTATGSSSSSSSSSSKANTKPIPASEEFGTTGFQLTPCSLSDAQRNECIRKLISDVLPYLKGGLPEYNLGSIDPYFYRRGIFRYANDGIQGGLLIKNMQIHGISNLKVNSFVGNFTENGMVVKLALEIPRLKADGQFKADVKFGGLRLVPKGPFNITIDNVRATVLTDGKLMRIDNDGLRVQLNRLNANVSVGNTKIIANGIFSDRNLNAMILNLVNENLPEITRVGIPATREQWAPILVEHINNFFANVPTEKFLVQ